MLSLLVAALLAAVPPAPASPAPASPATAPSPAASPPSPASSASAAARWEDTLARVSSAVVAIRISVPRAFDTESATTGLATGFVVDAERGILLTNRHVVQPGPVVAEAVFADHEEVALTPIYRDPVHDFGFYRFDPAALRHQRVVALPLAPEGAKVGVDIRVVGNDAGEKLSFLPGILARLDRDAPVYGRGFNDFNTFYYQAASGTSGGSSGSPVVDIDGRVIALNAGGRTNAATSYYLPLDRVVRALGLVQAGKPVPRGTWQAVLSFEAFDELRRLGLPADLEATVRAESPDGTGMLVVSETVPGGPARGRLAPGDVVWTVEGRRVTGFTAWEGLLDDHVGGTLHVVVVRGGKTVDVDVPVDDLHAITPSAYLEIGGGVLNDLSFQLARNYGVPVQGVYVATGGGWLSDAGVPDASVIVGAEGHPVTGLGDLETILSTLPDGAPVHLRYFRLGDVSARRVATATVSRRWFPARHCSRDDRTGLWPCRDLDPAPGAWSPPPGTTTPLLADKGPGRTLAPSLVWVSFTAPMRPEGLYGDHFIGTGVVIDAERGLVLTDRDTVPLAAGDVRLTFGGTLEIPARVRMVHPYHDIAVVQYDPALLGATPVKAVTWSDAPLVPGAGTFVVGLSPRQEVAVSATSVSTRVLLESALPNPPYFRDRNLDIVDVGDGGRAVGGVLTDKRGAVMGLWASFVDASRDPWAGFHRGIPADVVRAAIDPVLTGGEERWSSLGAELGTLSLVDARELGLSDADVALLAKAGGATRRALQVRRVDGAAPGAAGAGSGVGGLRGGDVIVRVGGEPCVDPARVEAAVRGGVVTMDVLRDGQIVSLSVSPSSADGLGQGRLVQWAGALLHETPLPATLQRGAPPGGVYVSWQWHGSPAQAYALWPTMRIVAVDDVPTPTLDAFVAAVAGRPDRSPVRLRVRTLDEKESVLTLKVDLAYWPTTELVRGADGQWVRRGL